MNMRLFLASTAFLFLIANATLGFDSGKWIWRLEPKHRKTWVFLIAGSNGWYNYRHQADVFHAYQIALQHGISPNNIITMAYDDIAYNPLNPYPGEIFNSPNGTNVYKDVIINYKGSAVTPDNIVAIMTGNVSAVEGGDGHVLESTAEDNVFIYFSDHGAPGLVAVLDDVLTASRLNNAIKEMYRKKMYHNLVFYLEACESGSVFHGLLPSNINVYAVTAANTTQDSYAFYCDEEIPYLDVCLGDEFSVHWMEDADREDLRLEQLGLQYRIVQDEVQMSHVCRFGDTSIMSRFAAEFLGWKMPSSINEDFQKSKVVANKASTAWSSRDVPLLMQQRAIKREADDKRRAILASELDHMIMKRNYLDKFMRDFVATFVPDDGTAFETAFLKQPGKIAETKCYDTVIKAFIRKCFSFGKNPYALKYVYALANLCELKYNTEAILEHIDNKCRNIQFQEIH